LTAAPDAAAAGATAAATLLLALIVLTASMISSRVMPRKGTRYKSLSITDQSLHKFIAAATTVCTRVGNFRKVVCNCNQNEDEECIIVVKAQATCVDC